MSPNPLTWSLSSKKPLRSTVALTSLSTTQELRASGARSSIKPRKIGTRCKTLISTRFSESRVFELENLERLKKCSKSVEQAHETIERTKHQLDQSQKVLDRARTSRTRKANDGSKPKEW